MNKPQSKLALGLAIVLAAPSFAFAEGFYASAQLGGSIQATDSGAYGNNIALDSDFPSEFEAGDGGVGAIGIGYAFTKNLRLEGRISYREASFNEQQLGTGARAGEEYVLNGDLDSTSLTIEGFYDFANGTAFTPYLKAGLGIADNSYSARLGGAGVAAFDTFDGAADGYYDNYADGDSTELTWNIGAGGSYQVNDSLAIYGEYQYANLGDISTGQDSFSDGFKIDDITAHEVMVGVRVAF
jgi:opacity protein-like surface antigen